MSWLSLIVGVDDFSKLEEAVTDIDLGCGAGMDESACW